MIDSDDWTRCDPVRTYDLPLETRSGSFRYACAGCGFRELCTPSKRRDFSFRLVGFALFFIRGGRSCLIPTGHSRRQGLPQEKAGSPPPLHGRAFVPPADRGGAALTPGYSPTAPPGECSGAFNSSHSSAASGVSSFGSAHDASIITYRDLTRDAKHGDGTDTPFAPGHRADDIFFLVEPEVGRGPEFLGMRSCCTTRERPRGDQQFSKTWARASARRGTDG